MKNLKIVLLFFVTWKAQAQMIYSESANFFHLADQVALWHESTTTHFRDYWTERYGFSQSDKIWFDGFASIRRKYNPELINKPNKQDIIQNVLTDVEQKNDPLVDAFFLSTTIPEALKRLEQVLPQQERQFFQDFFQHYDSRLQDFKKDSASYKGRIKELNSQLTQFRFDQHLRKIETYLGLSKDPGQTPSQRYPSYLVWWPPLSRAELSQIGPYIILRSHPSAHFEKMGAEVALEGAVRALLRSLGADQKMALAQRFSASCGLDLAELTPRHIEIPMSLALSRMIFDEEQQKRQFVAVQEWSSDALVSLMTKLLFPELKRSLLLQETFSESALARAGMLCKELNALSGRDKKL